MTMCVCGKNGLGYGRQLKLACMHCAHGVFYAYTRLSIVDLHALPMHYRKKRSLL